MVDISLWFTLGTLGMVVGTAMLTYGLVLVPREKWRLLAWIAAVPAIAAVAYGLMALGFGGFRAPDGALVFIPRYVDWLLTTPIHVAVIAVVVGASRPVVARIAGLQALTIVFGFAAAALTAPASWALYALGSLCFAGVVYTFYGDLEDRAAAATDEAAALFRKLRAFVVVLWLVYPVIWLLGSAGLGVMDSETAALVVSYIDVVSKVGFGLIAINNYVKLAAIDDELPDDGESPRVGPDFGDEDAPAAD
jgi:sensory rhodopsin